MLERFYYSDAISAFLDKDSNAILGTLAAKNAFSLEATQRNAWMEEIRILKEVLQSFRDRGAIYFEYSIPRLGKRIDVVILIESVVFVLEFKVGETEFTVNARDQVYDYVLDLKNFHESSHHKLIVPILIATSAAQSPPLNVTQYPDQSFSPIECTPDSLSGALKRIVDIGASSPKIDPANWAAGRYCPTPTIIEAATALYSGHSVDEISRRDADAINLSETSSAISKVIETCRANSTKAICFVTGVPGAGKTLVGLNIATQNMKLSGESYSVFLSGNGPLVDVLREALARNKVAIAKERAEKLKKSEVLSEVKAFIQNVHHFRDDCLADLSKPPIEHVALFDEAQRAWDRQQTSDFMRRKKGTPDFNQSEPQFLISCMDRHPDWAVIVCLIGGGQEINTGEAGIGEWIDSLCSSFPHWHIYISSHLTDSEYAAGEPLKRLNGRTHVEYINELHLAVSMRSFRAELVSLLIKQLLDLQENDAAQTLKLISKDYPIVITRDLNRAKKWLKQRARGTERYGLVASSQAQRLKPFAIDIRSEIEPINWFLNGKTDVRSSYYLEDVATEFHVQGLELDWVCVAWDADFRFSPSGWENRSFCGDQWNSILKVERQIYLKNAYRVLLTRVRQGMVVFVPEGDSGDPTRDPLYYESTYQYLCRIGFESI